MDDFSFEDCRVFDRVEHFLGIQADWKAEYSSQKELGYGLGFHVLWFKVVGSWGLSESDNEYDCIGTLYTGILIINLVPLSISLSHFNVPFNF